MRNFLVHCVLPGALLLNSSCASMLNGTTETIHVRSEIPETKFYLDDKEIGTDRASVVVSKKKLKKVTLHAKREGCEPTSTNIDTKFDPTTLLGLLIDLGIISILVVDWAKNGTVIEARRTGYVLSPICPGRVK